MTGEIFQFCILLLPIFLQVPLRYLIAMLFVNFKPLWDPVIELVVCV